MMPYVCQERKHIQKHMYYLIRTALHDLLFHNKKGYDNYKKKNHHTKPILNNL